MARNDTLIRALMVANALQGSRRGMTVQMLKARCDGTSLSSVYRDLAALSAAGFPIHKDGDRYVLDHEWKPPALRGFDEDEVLALNVARAMASGLKTTKLGRALDRAWVKVTSADGRTGELPDTMRPWFSVRAPHGIDYRKHEKTIAVMEQAIEGRRTVNCRYRAVSTGELSARVLEPVELHWDPGLESLYVFAWCRLRKDVRIFAVHRFVAAALTDDTFHPRAEVRSQKALKHAFRLWRSENVHVVEVAFDASVAAEVRERRWSQEQEVVDDGDGVRVRFPAAGLEEVERWVLGYGARARVLGPEALVARVRAQVEGMAGIYGGRRGARKGREVEMVEARK